MEISILQTSILPVREIKNAAKNKEVITLQIRMENLEYFISTVQPQKNKRNFELPVFGAK